MKNFMGIFLFIFFIMGASTQAFTLNSNSSSFRGWSNPEIRFQANLANCPNGVDVLGILADAMKVWNNVPTSRLKLIYVGETTATTGGDPVTIFCDPDYASGGAAADFSPGAAAVAPGVGDRITGGIMYLNASSGDANIANLSRDIVAVVLAHEIGHLVGLGHSQDVNALMYYSAGLKTNLGLAQDDIDGITYLYPRNELGSDKPYGCGTLTHDRGGSLPPASPTANHSWPYALFLLPLFAWVFCRYSVRMS